MNNMSPLLAARATRPGPVVALDTLTDTSVESRWRWLRGAQWSLPLVNDLLVGCKTTGSLVDGRLSEPGGLTVCACRVNVWWLRVTTNNECGGSCEGSARRLQVPFGLGCRQTTSVSACGGPGPCAGTKVLSNSNFVTLFRR